MTALKNDVICARQIAFAAAFLLPAAKLLEVPALLAERAAGDLLLPAALHFLLQTGVLLGILYAASRSERTLLERLRDFFGRGRYAFYALYGVYFIFAALLPVLDFEKFVYAAFFDTSPTGFTFALFFFLAAFACTKGLKGLGRISDLCLALFLAPFLAVVGMSLSETDLTHLLPLLGTKFGDTMSAFTYTTPHFSDAILLLPLIGNLRYKKGDTLKIAGGYLAGAVSTLLFLAVFFGIYSSLAPREHYAFSKIAQYFPALSTVGRVDLVFVYLLTAVLAFFTCMPMQYTVDLACRIASTQKRTLFAALLSLAFFLFALNCNRFYDALYALICGKLPLVFWLVADMVPLFLIFLPKEREVRRA